MSSKNSPALGYAINRAVKRVWNEYEEQPGLRILYKSSGRMDFG
jgi:hypothetical protein